VLPSINKFLSRISDGNWDLTPNHSNLVESAHAGRNAETSIGVNVLTAIQEYFFPLILYPNIYSLLRRARARDNQRFMDIQQTIREGVSPRRWNGIGEREKRSAQRQTWQARKSAHRDQQLSAYDLLKLERDEGAEVNKASLARSKEIESHIKAIQLQIAIDRHRSDLPEEVASLRLELEQEKSSRKPWTSRRAEIDKEIQKLKDGGLLGVRINGRRLERPAGGQDTQHTSSSMGLQDSAPSSRSAVGNTSMDTDLNSFQGMQGGYRFDPVYHLK
jgi:hypothetical protein